MGNRKKDGAGLDKKTIFIGIAIGIAVAVTTFLILRFADTFNQKSDTISSKSAPVNGSIPTDNTKERLVKLAALLKRKLDTPYPEVIPSSIQPMLRIGGIEAQYAYRSTDEFCIQASNLYIVVGSDPSSIPKIEDVLEGLCDASKP